MVGAGLAQDLVPPSYQALRSQRAYYPWNDANGEGRGVFTSQNLDVSVRNDSLRWFSGLQCADTPRNNWSRTPVRGKKLQAGQGREQRAISKKPSGLVGT